MRVSDTARQPTPPRVGHLLQTPSLVHRCSCLQQKVTAAALSSSAVHVSTGSNLSGSTSRRAGTVLPGCVIAIPRFCPAVVCHPVASLVMFCSCTPWTEPTACRTERQGLFMHQYPFNGEVPADAQPSRYREVPTPVQLKDRQERSRIRVACRRLNSPAEGCGAIAGLTLRTPP